MTTARGRNSPPGGGARSLQAAPWSRTGVRAPAIIVSVTAARLELAAAVVAAIVKTMLGSPPTPNAERVVPTRRDRTSTHGHLPAFA